MMYKDLVQIVKNDPDGAFALRSRMLDDLRRPSQFLQLSKALDAVGSSKFVDEAVEITGAKRDEAAGVSELLNRVLSYLVLSELLWQSSGGSPRDDVKLADLDMDVEETLDRIQRYAGSLPGLISHYHSLGVRNVHDELILECLQLGFLETVT